MKDMKVAIIGTGANPRVEEALKEKNVEVVRIDSEDNITPEILSEISSTRNKKWMADRIVPPPIPEYNWEVQEKKKKGHKQPYKYHK